MVKIRTGVGATRGKSAIVMKQSEPFSPSFDSLFASRCDFAAIRMTFLVRRGREGERADATIV
jgi:hypothetical protein